MIWRILSDLSKIVQGIITILAFLGILAAPVGIVRIDALWGGVTAWVVWSALIYYVIGLTPYRGQKAITEEQKVEYEKKLKDMQKVIDGYAATERR